VVQHNTSTCRYRFLCVCVTNGRRLPRKRPRTSQEEEQQEEELTAAATPRRRLIKLNSIKELRTEISEDTHKGRLKG